MNVLMMGSSQALDPTLYQLAGQYPGLSVQTRPLHMAWDHLRAHEVDLAVLAAGDDPEAGLALIGLIRSSLDHRTLPVLVVCAPEARDWRDEALRLGATDWLQHPSSPPEALARLQNMLAGPRLVRQLAQAERQLDQLTTEVVAHEREVAFRLTKVAYLCDPVTGAHLLRMPHYAKHIAAQLGWPAEEQELLLRAAPLHDVGTITVGAEIMSRRGAATPEEHALLQQHTLRGHDLLKDSSSPLLQLAATIALTHHEHFDGSGYPQGLEGEDIPMVGRIVAVADCFDDYLTGRPYRSAWPAERIKDHLAAQAGRMFDPRCVEAFFRDWDHVQRIVEMF